MAERAKERVHEHGTRSDAHDHDHGHDHAHDHHDHHDHDHHDDDAPHGHEHDLRGVPESRIRIALGLTASLMVVEFVAGIWSRSVALTSDAGHLFADVGMLTLALFAQRFAARTASRAWTYGFKRAEILAASINGMALAGTAAVVIVAAWGRMQHPVAIRGDVVSAVGVVGLLVNLASAWVLGGGHGHNLNTRAALLHVLTDAVGSFVAIASGLLAWRFGLLRADPALSFVMAALILWGAWSVLRRAAAILMEGTPPGLDLPELARTIRATPGVADLHDLHAWTIAEGFDSITVHVVLDGQRHGTDVAREVGERIHAIHRVAHVTVQPEAPVGGSSFVPVRSLLDGRRRV